MSTYVPQAKSKSLMGEGQPNQLHSKEGRGSIY